MYVEKDLKNGKHELKQGKYAIDLDEYQKALELLGKANEDSQQQEQARQLLSQLLISVNQLPQEISKPPEPEAVPNMNPANLVTPPAQPAKQSKHSRSKWWSLRNKATLLAITLGTVPVIAIGTVAYYFADQEVARQVKLEKQARATEIADKINRFIFERYGDIQILANLPILRNPKVRQVTTPQERQAMLNRFIDAYQVYDSIALLDLNGNVILQTQGTPLPNHKDRAYFQQVLKTDQRVISAPEISKSSGDFVIHFAAPVKDSVTGKTIGVIRSRMSMQFVSNVIKNFGTNGGTYHLFDSSRKYFVASDKQDVGNDVLTDFPGVASFLQKGEKEASQIMTNSNHHRELVTYTAPRSLEGLPQLNWNVLLTTPPEVAFAPQRKLFLTIALGTGVAALLVGLLAAYLANRATRPVLNAAGVVEKIGQGDLDARIQVAGEDELAQLGTNINSMAEQIKALLNQTEEQARFQQAEKDKLRQQVNVITQTVAKIGQGDLDSRITSSGEGDLAVLGTNINSMAEQIKTLLEQTEEQARQKKAEQEKLQRQVDTIAGAVTDIAAGKLDTRIPKLEGGGIIQALVDNINQMTEQIQNLLVEQEALTIEQQKVAAERKAEAEALTQRVLKLLSEVKGVAKGDLTTRAEVTDDMMGSVADSFNFLTSSLRKLINGIQDVASQVTTATSESIGNTSELAKQAHEQARQIEGTLQQIERMLNSIQDVSDAANRASAVAEKAAATAEAGGNAVERTFAGINELRQTIAETSKMMKRLGEGSQQIGSIVTSISQIASQTNLLALNATIEAARAGEHGQGFAVVAEEVRKLAERSASATEEISKIVETIQGETSRVMQAMESGTQEVVKGTQLAAEAKTSLDNIIDVTREIDDLIQNINRAASKQATSAEQISGNIQQMSSVSTSTAQKAQEVTSSLDGLSVVVDKLQGSVQNFRTR